MSYLQGENGDTAPRKMSVSTTIHLIFHKTVIVTLTAIKESQISHFLVFISKADIKIIRQHKKMGFQSTSITQIEFICLPLHVSVLMGPSSGSNCDRPWTVVHVDPNYNTTPIQEGRRHISTIGIFLRLYPVMRTA
jgi:hypothetical protein